MFKVLKNKLIIASIGVLIVGGVSIKTLSVFDKTNTEIKKTQTSNIKDVSVDSKNDIDKNKNSLSDEQNLNENSEYNNNDDDDDDDKNKQETTNYKSEKSNNITKNQTTDIVKSNDENSNVNIENQESPNANLEVNTSTIHYDRTTSIYANDNITLLRVEYYVNNRLTYYSVVEQFDAATKSYIEKIYKCNRETNIDPLIRTDVYSNGNLISSY